MSEKIISLLGGIGFLIAFGASVWGPWPERVYEKQKESNVTWYWLSVLAIPRTKANCVLFIRICASIGMALVSIGTLFVVLKE